MESAKAKAKPKTPPTKRKSRASKLSKEQLLIALQKKKECNARAQKVIEASLDPIPPEKVINFLSDLIHLNQAHYDDIIEERSISVLCGYPLCDKTLTDIPKQQFIISRAQNKVFDITERKKYCSNECYRASVYLREQILTTPLWVRKDDDIIPEFKLLSFKDEEIGGGKDDDIIPEFKLISFNDEEIGGDKDEINGSEKDENTKTEKDRDLPKTNKNEKNTNKTEVSE